MVSMINSGLWNGLMVCDTALFAVLCKGRYGEDQQTGQCYLRRSHSFLQISRGGGPSKTKELPLRVSVLYDRCRLAMEGSAQTEFLTHRGVSKIRRI